MPIGAAVPMLIQGGIGLAQLIGGAVKNKNTKLDPYNPSAERNLANIAQSETARSVMPGQHIYEDKIRGATANTIDAAKMATNDPNKVLSAVSRAQTAENKAINNLGLAGLNFQERSRDRRDRAIMNQGRSEERAWKYNELMPYERDSATASALMGGGMSNMFGGMSNIAGLQMLKEY